MTLALVGAQFWGLVVQPYGGGNSVLVLALRSGPSPSRALAVIGLLAGAVLLVGRDLHGGTVAIGALVAAGLLRSGTRPSPAAS